MYLWFYTKDPNFVTPNEYYTWKPVTFGYMANNVLFCRLKVQKYIPL